MPWYDYQCRSCEHKFTEVLMMDDRDKPTRKKCPDCGRKTVSKLFGNVYRVDATTIGLNKNDESYKEVISQINEKSRIKGTRYELHAESAERHKTLKHLNNWEIKKEVADRLK